MLIWVLQSSHCFKIRLAQHCGRRGANVSENEGVRSECKKFGENSRQMAPVSTICDEYCNHFHFFPKDKPWKHERERTNRRLAQATIQEVLHRSRCFAHRSSRARGLIRGWIQTAWRMDALPKKSHQRSQSTGCVLVRKAPTTPHSQATAPQAKDRWGLQGRPRWGIQHETGC